MPNPTTIEEVLTTMWHAANLTPWDKDSVVDVVRPSVDEALATIEQLVLEKVIGEDEAINPVLDADWATVEVAAAMDGAKPYHLMESRNLMRGRQRQALKQLMGGEE